MALPTFVGVTAGDVPHSSAALSVPLPTGIAAKDKLLLIVNTRANEAVGSISGWTEPPFSPVVPASGDYRLTIFERDATGSDTDPTVPDSGDHQIAFIVALRSGTGALLEIKHSNTSIAAASTSLSFPTITTAGNDYLVLNVVSDDWDDASAARYSAWANASLGSVTERYDGGWTTNGGGGLGLATGTKATAGAVSATTATLASSVAVSMATFAIGDVAGASTQNITGALFTNSQTFYGATVGRGAVDITGALVTNAQTFYGATVAASYAITGAKFDNSQTFYAATVTSGSVDIAGALYTNTQTFYGATVSQASASQDITAALFTNVQSFFEATVSVGAVDITAELFTNEQVFFGATVSAASDQTQRGDDAPSGRNRFYVTRHYYVIEQPEPRKKRKAKPSKPVTQAVVEEAISTLPQWAAVQFTPATAMQALPNTISLNRAAIDRSSETLALVEFIRAELLRQAEDDEDDIELLLMVA